jgi:O-antigen ligase
MLLALLLAVAAFAAFSGGAIEIPAETRVEVALAALGLGCVAGLCLGRLRPGGGRLAWAGVGLLAAFGVWSGISGSWSIAPDESWLATNTAIAYAVVAAVALVAGASIENAGRWAALGLVAVSGAVALYALGGKIVPGLHIGPLDLNPGDGFARLREPIDYWNALALLCVMATPACIWQAATTRERDTPGRIAALVVLALLLLTAALSYSRGAIIAYAVVLAIMVGAGPRRLTRLAVGLGAVAAMTPAMLFAFGRHDLSSSDVGLAERADDGLLLGAVLVVSLAALALAARTLFEAETRVAWGPERARRAWRGLAAVGACLAIAGVVVLALSDRGFTGEVSHQVDSFTEPAGRSSNTPERLVSSTSSNRYVWWQEALGAFSDRPIAGWGAGSFPLLHYLYRRYEAPARSAHSLPLQLAAETGLVGATLALAGLALLAAAAVGAVRGDAGGGRDARLALLAAFAAWAVHSLYDWDWEIPAVTVPALVAVAVASSAGRAAALSRRRPIALPRPRAAVAIGAAALAAAGMAVSVALPALSEGRRLDALAAAGAGGDLGRAASDAEEAADLDPLAVDPRFTVASVARVRGQVAEELAALIAAARTQPDNAAPWRQLVVAYSLHGYRGRDADALAQWARADPLLFRGAANALRAQLFRLRYPAPASPTALGTPPP